MVLIKQLMYEYSIENDIYQINANSIQRKETLKSWSTVARYKLEIRKWMCMKNLLYNIRKATRSV